jgi:hypothetical protein
MSHATADAQFRCCGEWQFEEFKQCAQLFTDELVVEVASGRANLSVARIIHERHGADFVTPPRAVPTINRSVSRICLVGMFVWSFPA